MQIGKKVCFVIMPFSQTTSEHTAEYWTGHYELFLKPTLENTGKYDVKRIKALHGDILNQIVTDLIVSPLVVADLTDANPNVYWELGVRQSFKNGTVTIAEAGTELPFDIGAKGTLFYHPKDHIKNSEFVKDFRQAVEEIYSNPNSSDSKVLEVVSGRGSFFEITRKDEAIRRVSALIEEIHITRHCLLQYRVQ